MPFLLIFCLLVDFYNSMKYSMQNFSIGHYLEKWSFCWCQQFARVTQ